MGRYVYENGTSVWKYVFAEQGSEQHRIADELGIGEINELEDGYGDKLSLTNKDIQKLEDYMNEKISYDIMDVKNSVTRLDVVEFYDKIMANFDMIRCDSIEDDMFEIIRKMFNHDIHFWRMIVAYINHMKSEDNDNYEFVGEY